MYKSALPDKQKKKKGYLVLFMKKWIMFEDNVFSKYCVFFSSEDKEVWESSWELWVHSHYISELDWYSCFATWAEYEGWKSILYPQLRSREITCFFRIVWEDQSDKEFVLHSFLGPTVLFSAFP